jgi:ribonuclease HII
LAEGDGVEGADDSKRVPREERERLAQRIRQRAVAVTVGAASAREIDGINILRATARAMERAIRRLPRRPDHVVVDGLPMRDLSMEHVAVVGGDRRVHSIACASIVAKVCRDRLMTRLARRYPEYGWERNMGYGTAEHRAAIRRLGPTPHHRLTFGLEQLELTMEGERTEPASSE